MKSIQSLRAAMLLLLFLFSIVFVPLVSAASTVITTENAAPTIDGTSVIVHSKVVYSGYGTNYFVLCVRYVRDGTEDDYAQFDESPWFYVTSGVQYNFNVSGLYPDTLYKYQAYTIRYDEFDVFKEVKWGDYEYFTTGETSAGNVSMTVTDAYDVTDNDFKFNYTATYTPGDFAGDWLYLGYTVERYSGSEGWTQQTGYVENTTGTQVVTLTDLNNDYGYRYFSWAMHYNATGVFQEIWTSSIKEVDWGVVDDDEEWLGYDMDVWKAIFCLGLTMFFFILPSMIVKGIPKEVNVISGFIAVVGMCLFGFVPLWLMFIFALILVVFIVYKIKR